MKWTIGHCSTLGTNPRDQEDPCCAILEDAAQVVWQGGAEVNREWKS